MSCHIGMSAEGHIRAMDEHVLIETPEHIELRFELAGLGTRFVAVLIDHLLQILVTGLVGLIVSLTALGQDIVPPLKQSIIWAIAVGFILIFIALWGYFAIFETAWNGQTPGKRVAGIRVVRDDGTPISFLDAMVRNLVRVVDFLPGYYTIGIIALFISPQNKRLGDYAAGTIVIKERTAPIPEMPELNERTGNEKLMPNNPQLVATLRNVAGRLTAQELQMAQRYTERRLDLDPQARVILARKIALPLIEKLSLEGISASYDDILEAIALIGAERRSTL